MTRAKPPETGARRVAVVLGTSRSGRALLEALRPLLGQNTGVNLQGVFIVDEALQRAAALPFAKELCQLTLNVKDLHGAGLESSVSMRTRSAHRAIAGFAQSMGVSYTFQDLRGPTINLLQRTAHAADVTLFEPLHLFVTMSALPAGRPREQRRRVVAAIDSMATAARTLAAASLLAEGELDRVSILLADATRARQDALDDMISRSLGARPSRVLSLPGTGTQYLITAVRSEGAALLVLGASDELLEPGFLRSLRERLSCPVCLVRQWDGNGEVPAP